MFNVIQLEDKVKIPAYYINKEETNIKFEIEKKFLNKVLKNIGLVISIFDIQKVENMIIHMNDQGAAYADVTFRLVIFAPVVGEVIEGLLQEITPHGLRRLILNSRPRLVSKILSPIFEDFSIGFFNDIWVYQESLKYPCQYEKETWFWVYEEQMLPYELNKRIRVKVDSVSYKEKTDEKPLGDKDLTAAISPMVVYANTVQDGLGMLLWWVGSKGEDNLSSMETGEKANEAQEDEEEEAEDEEEEAEDEEEEAEGNRSTNSHQNEKGSKMEVEK